MSEKKNSMSLHESISLFIPGDVIARERSNSFLKNLIITKIGYFSKAYGHSIYRDTSSEYILLYCIDGKGWIDTGGKKREVVKGDLVFCDINCPHGYGADNSNPWTIYWAHFSGEGVTELFNALDISKDNPLLKIGENLKIVSFFEEAYNVLSNGYSFPNLFRSSTCFQEIFCFVIEIKMYSGLKGNINLDIEGIINFMKENLSACLSLEQLAEYASMSKYHFIRKFKDITGYSPVEYFNRLKIQKACELLDTSHNSINEISELLGFNNPNYFSEVFKRIAGYPPRKYKNLSVSKE